MLMATKLRKVVTYLEGLLPIKSCEKMITWPCEITLQIKTIIMTTTMLMTTKLDRVVGLLTMRSFYP